jgi:hypothetical protein
MVASTKEVELLSINPVQKVIFTRLAFAGTVTVQERPVTCTDVVEAVEKLLVI